MAKKAVPKAKTTKAVSKTTAKKAPPAKAAKKATPVKAAKKATPVKAKGKTAVKSAGKASKPAAKGKAVAKATSKKATPVKAKGKDVVKGKAASKGKAVKVKKIPKEDIIKVRAKKDPLCPKKARSAYTYYLEESHARIKVSNPDAPFGAVSKQISAEWKAMSDAQKRRYEELSRQDKLRFAEEKSEYVPAPGYGDDGHALVKKKPKHRRAKRGFCSAYIIFVVQMRPVIMGENPKIANTDIMKEAGNRWRVMTPAQKQPWEELAAQDKARHEAEEAARALTSE